jgi:hypothetical protein
LRCGIGGRVEPASGLWSDRSGEFGERSATRSAGGASTLTSEWPRRRFCMKACPAMMTCAVASVRRLVLTACGGLTRTGRIPGIVTPSHASTTMGPPQTERGHRKPSESPAVSAGCGGAAGVAVVHRASGSIRKRVLVTTTVDPPPLDEVLDWLRLQADQNVPETLQANDSSTATGGRSQRDARSGSPHRVAGPGSRAGRGLDRHCSQSERVRPCTWRPFIPAGQGFVPRLSIG